VIEERQVAHVQRERAPGSLDVDDNRDRAALHTFAETDAATAGEVCVREPL
jgi:hypothetical protein